MQHPSKQNILCFLLAMAFSFLSSPSAYAGWAVLYDKNSIATDDIPEEAKERLGIMANAGDQLKLISFTPDSGWVVLSNKNEIYSRNIPDEAYTRLLAFGKQGAELKSISFTRAGGWAILYDKNRFFTRNIPDEAYQRLGILAKNGSVLKSISFAPNGGWCIVHDKNGFFTRNIADEAFQKLGELAKQGAEIKSVSFGPKDSWAILHDKNGFTTRNIPNEAFRKLGDAASQGSDIQSISFTVDPFLSHLSLDDDATRTKVLDRMSFYKVPGMSIAIIEEGQVHWARTYGVSEVSGQAVVVETRFQAASISKPVATLGVLRLVQEGKLELDGELNTYLTSWKIPDSRFAKQSPPTIRHVLTHSGGFNVHGFGGYADRNAVPSLLQLLDGKPPTNSAKIRVEFLPGSQVKYSGGGFCVLQQALEDVVKKPFPAMMDELVLKPVGMSQSSFEQPLPSSLEGSAAVGHKNGIAIPAKRHIYPEMAAAGLWTTPSDLARCCIAVQQSVQEKPGALLNATMSKELLNAPLKGQGLGFQIRGEGDKIEFSHGGVNEGFDCYLVATARSGHGLVIMANANGAGALMNEVAQAIRREYRW
jgi:CubicO group peptidase (beta-lactamase class C family)